MGGKLSPSLANVYYDMLEREFESLKMVILKNTIDMLTIFFVWSKVIIKLNF